MVVLTSLSISVFSFQRKPNYVISLLIQYFQELSSQENIQAKFALVNNKYIMHVEHYCDTKNDKKVVNFQMYFITSFKLKPMLYNILPVNTKQK